MSRSSEEYQFVATDTSELVTQLISTYEQMTCTSVQPASPEKLFILWVANIIVQERVLLNYTGNQNIPSRAAGENLDALAELFYLSERPGAKPATCTERFFISEAQSFAILVPKGTRVTDASSTLFWETVEDAYVLSGETYVDVQVQCQTAGTVGNGFAPGQLSTLVDIYDYYSACVNVTESDSGSEQATDDEFYELMRASQDAYSTAGSKGSYIYHAKSVSTEIADVVPIRPNDGEVALYVLMNDGNIAGEEVKAAVLAACSPDDVRPLADYVTVEDPDIVTYDIELTYYIASTASKSSAEIQVLVNDAVKKYITWQSGKLGRDINPDKLRDYLLDAGVKRISLTSPAFTVLRDGKDNLVPQIAQLESCTVVNGGIEDE